MRKFDFLGTLRTLAVVLFASAALVACGGDDDDSNNNNNNTPEIPEEPAPDKPDEPQLPDTPWLVNGAGSMAVEVKGEEVEIYVAPTEGATSLDEIKGDKFFYHISCTKRLVDGKTHELATLTQDVLWGIRITKGNSGVMFMPGSGDVSGTISVSYNEGGATGEVKLDMTYDGVAFWIDYSGSVLKVGDDVSGNVGEALGEGEVVIGESERYDLLSCYYDTQSTNDYVTYYFTPEPAASLAELADSDVVVVDLPADSLEKDKELTLENVAVQVRGVDYTGTMLFYEASEDGYITFMFTSADPQFEFGYEGYSADALQLED